MSDESLSIFLPLLREGDPEAIERVWKYFNTRIVALANKKIAAKLRRIVDGEDVAQLAFKSCFRVIQEGCAPELHDREHLWALLATITARKVINLNIHYHTAKEGGGKVLGESAFGTDSDSSNPGIQGVADREPWVRVGDILTEQTEQLLKSVDEDTRQVAILHLQSFKAREISKTLGFSLAKVERKLKKIHEVGRKIEAQMNESGPRE